MDVSPQATPSALHNAQGESGSLLLLPAAISSLQSFALRERLSLKVTAAGTDRSPALRAAPLVNWRRTR